LSPRVRTVHAATALPPVGVPPHRYRVARDLARFLRPIAELREDPDNARSHSGRNVDVIAASLDTNGQQKPLSALADGLVIAGNGTLRAAVGLEWTHLAALPFDGKDHRLFAIDDNRTGELSDWDEVALRDAIRELEGDGVSIDALGFNADEIAALGSDQEWVPPAEAPLPEPEAPMQRVVLTEAERRVLEQAFAQVRTQAGDASMSEGRACELLCADWMAGASPRA
jgi:hypothetical protein